MVFHLPDPRNTPVAHIAEEFHSALSGRNPMRELTNGFHENDLVENIFADVIDNTYGRSGAERNSWSRSPAIQDDFGIDYSHDRFVRNENSELLRTSRQLMTTLDRHAGGINIGRHSDHITKNELRNYLTRVGDNISPQDKADLCLVMRDFDQIALADGKQGKGISYRDMAFYVMENQ